MYMFNEKKIILTITSKLNTTITNLANVKQLILFCKQAIDESVMHMLSNTYTLRFVIRLLLLL